MERKNNLIVCWFGTFVTSVGMSQIAPILPLYIKQLGINDTGSIAQWSGIAFGATFIISALFSPIWGQAADKFGKKPMLLRASFGMAFVVFWMGFAQNVYQFVILRLLQGVITGYSTACNALIATQTDKEHAGWALATLSTGSIAGYLLGPVIGGYLGEKLGIPSVFFITAALLMIAFMATLIFVKEQFIRSDRKELTIRDAWNRIPNSALIMTVFVTTCIINFAFMSIEPIITVYVIQLSHNTAHVALLSGIAFSASGLASILSAPRLGKLSDKIGTPKVILVELIITGVFVIPQAFVNSPWELIGLRFLLGLSSAGLLPSLNALVKKITPDFLIGRVFGFNISAQYLGIFGGSVLGGEAAAHFGIQSVFFITSILLWINALWIYKTVYREII
ncbi:multidrug efflux MFS transporter [Candidatus Formimonas warabiya]|uniref:MFS transporter n=1 Tax=Formimonas warabiya TaxID=1761012 RepID=A0A3G1KP93_FORW1|nr:MFS transporter [Candidatus Formimonas warabiya]